MQTSTEVLIHHSSLLNQHVTDQSASEKLGRVTQIWLDYQKHEVIGLTCQLGLWDNNPCTFSWAQIAAIEAQRILVKAIPTYHLSVTLNLELERMTPVDTHIDHEVWTYTGKYVGTVSNCRIDPHSGVVKDYVLMSNSWRSLTRQRFYLSPNQIIDVGRGWIMVPDTVMQEIGPGGAGMSIDGRFPTALA